MSGRSSKSKGARGEAAARRLFREHDYEVIQTAAGVSNDDFMALKDGILVSVEVKNTCSLMLSYFLQTLKNASGKSRCLAWHPSRWNLPANLWVLFFWMAGERYGNVQVWRANGVSK